MKTSDSVKNEEIQALEAVTILLSRIPDLEIDAAEEEGLFGPDRGIDAKVDLRHGDKGYTLIIEYKRSGQPRHTRSAIYQLRNYLAHYDGPAFNRNLIPMLVAPYLSPEARAMCDEHRVAYLDLFGNARLAFNGVYIDRAVADKPKSEVRALRSIFTPKAAAILRVMFREPHEAWRVTELAEQADVSLGHVSNVRKALLEREWIEESGDGVTLVKPRALLESWRENYRRPLGKRINCYTHLHGQQLNERLKNVLNPHSNRPQAIYALHSAAEWLAPYSRKSNHSFYADIHGADALHVALDLSPAARGSNVFIQIPRDDGVFKDAIEPAPGIFCTSAIQTYLDLWIGNDRDKEAAEFLREERLSWLQ